MPSNSDSQANEREYVLNILRENNYPKDFLKNCLNPSACRNQNNSEDDTSIKGYAVVPYIQGVTEPIKRILSNCNIKVALIPCLTLGHIFAKPKDPIPTNQKTHAVYSIPCNDCEKEYLYIYWPGFTQAKKSTVAKHAWLNMTYDHRMG